MPTYGSVHCMPCLAGNQTKMGLWAVDDRYSTVSGHPSKPKDDDNSSNFGQLWFSVVGTAGHVAHRIADRG